MTAAFCQASSPAHSDGASEIKYRQAVMAHIGRHMCATDAILNGSVGDPADLTLHAKSLAVLARFGDRLFWASSSPEAGKIGAMARIWTGPDVFRAATDLFRADTKTLAFLAQTSDIAGVRWQLGVLGNTGSKACHIGFRACQ